MDMLFDLNESPDLDLSQPTVGSDSQFDELAPRLVPLDCVDDDLADQDPSAPPYRFVELEDLDPSRWDECVTPSQIPPGFYNDDSWAP